MKRTITKAGALLGLVCLFNIACLSQAPSKSAASNLSRDMAVAETVLREEIRVNQISAKNFVCLSMNGLRDPSPQLLSQLRKKGLRVNPGSWCTSGPQGYLVQLSPISWQGTYDAGVTVQLIDERRDLVDFSVLLRKGAYRLQLIPPGNWNIKQYEKACCTGERKVRAEVK